MNESSSSERAPVCVFVRLIAALLFRFVEFHFLSISNSNQRLLLPCLARLCRPNDIDDERDDDDDTKLMLIMWSNQFIWPFYAILVTVLMHTISHAHTIYQESLSFHPSSDKSIEMRWWMNDWIKCVWLSESNESSEFCFWNQTYSSSECQRVIVAVNSLPSDISVVVVVVLI